MRKHSKAVSAVLKILYIGLIMLFFYAPIAVMILFSFNAGISRAKFTGFSLQHYANMAADNMMLTALKNTLIIALIASAIATLIGTYAAFA